MVKYKVNKNDKLYYDDEVKMYGKLMKCVSRRWRKVQSDENYRALQFMAEKYREI